MSDRYAVVGNPIVHSLSPQIHAQFAAQTGEDIHYEKLLAEKNAFADFARNFFQSGGRGLNVTVPFKLDACEFADDLTERARAAGAVNTLKKLADGSVLGDNTDGAGLVADIRGNLGWPIRGKTILLLGAGGAARGALLPLFGEGPACVHIANRTAAKAEQLAREFSSYGEISGGGLREFPGAFDLIISASAAGLSNAMPALPETIVAADCKAYDMIYRAEPTPFMRWASANGADAADGLGMLVGQAAESFYLWRGVRPDAVPVLSWLRQELQN